MKFLFCMFIVLSGCTTDSPSGTTQEEGMNCALFGNTADVSCLNNRVGTTPSHCAWRGQACTIDECGLAPSYPGYAAGPGPGSDETTIKTDQWNALTAYMTAMQTFQACELMKQAQ